MTRQATNSEFDGNALPESMPLTSIEHFHLLSSSSLQPNVLICRILVARQLKRDVLGRAIEHVFRRHFAWNRRLVLSQKPIWKSDPSSENSALTWMEVDDAHFDQAHLPIAQDLEEKIDLRSTPGAHVWCQIKSQDRASATLSPEGPPESQAMLTFVCHHSITDGLGGTRFVNNFLIAYDNLIAGRAWDQGLRKLEPKQLLQRNRLGLNQWSYWKHIWKQPIALVGMAKFLFRRFHVITPAQTESRPQPDGNVDCPILGLTGRWIPEALSAQIDRFAADKSISVNTVAMASVFYALPTWSAKYCNAPQEKWFRMVLPISIASRDDLRSPVANRATIVQVDRCEQQMRDMESFLYYLDREIKIMIGWQFDKLFLIVVRMMSLSRWWLRRSATSPRARGTIVFTNLGETFRAVDKRANQLLRAAKDPAIDPPSEITDFDLGGPTRSAMPINFTIQRHRQRYRITARFDGHVIDAEQAVAFLQQVEDELSRVTGK